MKNLLLVCVLIAIASTSVLSQSKPLSQQAATTAMTALWRDPARNQNGAPGRWTYEYGVVLKGIESVWLSTGDGTYFNFIQQGLDRFVNDDGTIRTYTIEEYNIDNILTGRNLLMLYKVTGQEKYRKAATLLRQQLKTHPRTSDGGFWHKNIYMYHMCMFGI
jgi:unsaturated rhamnogalacturonyl hydrolase